MRVFVTAGTDHHPFQRLVDWLAAWHARHPEHLLVLQHGPATPVAGAENHVMLSGEDMESQLRLADVVVVSGGPGAVMAARAAGRKPIAVARRRGEAVDDHQVAFVELISARGLAHGVSSEGEMAGLLELAERDPGSFRCERPGDDPPDAARGIRRVVERLAGRQ